MAALPPAYGKQKSRKLARDEGLWCASHETVVVFVIKNHSSVPHDLSRRFCVSSSAAFNCRAAEFIDQIHYYHA